MSKDLEKWIEESTDHLRKIQSLEQEIKNMIDREEIVKPDSRNLVKDVLEAIGKHIVHRKPGLKARTVVDMIGSSRNWWRADVMIEDTEIEDEVGRVKAIIECKQIGEKTSINTYETAHIPRAHMELADLRNYEKSLRFVIFSHRLDRKGGRDFDSLFRTIGAEIIDWSDDYEWFLKLIERLVVEPNPID
ncbi:MAG: hypothetical protein ACETV1_00490 [Candidatus Bathyarchaeia archaeon]